MRDKANKAKASSNGKVDTIIGHETEVVGDVRFVGGLHIDGVVKGNIAAESNSDDALAVVSERGRVEGELRVPHIIINGQVTGDVYASERLDLAKHARVHGDVHYRTMEMASGAEINGKLLRVEHEPQGFLEHDRERAAADVESSVDAPTAGEEPAAVRGADASFGAGEKT